MPGAAASPCASPLFAPPIAYRGLVAGSSRRRVAHVLAGSSKLGPSRSLPFFHRSKLLMDSHSAGSRFLIAACCLVPNSHFPAACDRRPLESVSFAPDHFLIRSGTLGSQARQLHLTVLRLPGFISELLARISRPSRISLSFSQRTARSLRNSR